MNHQPLYFSKGHPKNGWFFLGICRIAKKKMVKNPWVKTSPAAIDLGKFDHDLTSSSRTLGIMVSKGNHPNMAQQFRLP